MGRAACLVVFGMAAVAGGPIARAGEATNRPAPPTKPQPLLLEYRYHGYPVNDHRVVVHKDGTTVRWEVDPDGGVTETRGRLTHKQIASLAAHLKDWRKLPNVYPRSPGGPSVMSVQITHEGHAVLADGGVASAGAFNLLLDLIEDLTKPKQARPTHRSAEANGAAN